MLNWKQTKLQQKKKWLKIVIKAKRFESEITITMRTIIYLSGQDREIKKEKKRIIGDTLAIFEEHALPIMKEKKTRNKLRQWKPIFHL